MTDLINDVLLEMSELRGLGIAVPASAEAYVRRNAGEIVEYRESGMRVSEIVDLVRDLASIGGK